MSEPGQERVTCPSCGKGYRWQDKLAGRTVPCKACGDTFIVPDAPGEGLPMEPAVEGGYELETPEIDQPRQLATPAVGGKCPNCNSPVKEYAVICINCGFDMQQGRKIEKPQVSELSVKDRKQSDKNAKAPMRGMSLVRVGLWLNLLAIVAVILAIPAAFITAGPGLFISGLLLIGSGVMAVVGYLLCLGAPSASGGRPVLIVSIVLSGIGLIGTLAIKFGSTPDDWQIAFDLADQVGTACFLYFFVMLARYLDFQAITERAEKVFGIFLVIAVGQYLLYLPLLFINCFIAIGILIAAIYFVVLYVLLLIDLNNALSYRIGEQKAEHAY